MANRDRKHVEVCLVLKVGKISVEQILEEIRGDVTKNKKKNKNARPEMKRRKKEHSKIGKNESLNLSTGQSSASIKALSGCDSQAVH